MAHQTRVDEFLNRLEDKADEGVARLVYAGRALSKSNEHLHMCVSTGVILIPIAEVEAISHVYERLDPNLVLVTVKNADRVRHVLRREQLEDTGASSAPSSAPDLSHWDHGTATDQLIHDACDATDVFVPPAITLT